MDRSFFILAFVKILSVINILNYYNALQALKIPLRISEMKLIERKTCLALLNLA